MHKYTKFKKENKNQITAEDKSKKKKRRKAKKLIPLDQVTKRVKTEEADILRTILVDYFKELKRILFFSTKHFKSNQRYSNLQAGIRFRKLLRFVPQLTKIIINSSLEHDEYIKLFNKGTETKEFQELYLKNLTAKKQKTIEEIDAEIKNVKDKIEKKKEKRRKRWQATKK